MELNAMKEREAICDVCHKMWQRGIVAANDGNVSVKLEDGTFLCTPSGVSKAAMTPEILVHLAAIISMVSSGPPNGTDTSRPLDCNGIDR